jgi:hypothetical protein
VEQKIDDRYWPGVEAMRCDASTLRDLMTSWPEFLFRRTEEKSRHEATRRQAQSSLASVREELAARVEADSLKRT